MKRPLTTAVLAVATLASVVANAVPASACGGGGGGVRSYARAGGFSRPSVASFARPAYSRASYARPAYSQPTYSQPTYSQPTYTQQVQAQPTYSQPLYSQPTVSQPTYASSTSVFSQPTTIARPSNQVVQQAPTVSASSSSIASAAVKPAPVNQVSATKSAATVKEKSAESNALALLVSMASSELKDAKPTTSTATAEAASAIPQFSVPVSDPAASSKAGSHVGTWVVALPGDQSVTLKMDAAGKFVWTAKKAGKSSQFDGQYRITNGRLTLVRSADLQQMNGTWTQSKNGFLFKLDGATTGGLKFQRS